MMSVNVHINDKRIAVPQIWSEVSLQTALRLVPVLHADMHELYDDHEALQAMRMKATLALINKPMDWLVSWEQSCEQGSFLMQLAELLKVSDWLFEPIDGANALRIAPTLTRQLLVKREMPNTATLYGPSDDGYNLTFAEFKDADNEFAAYCQDRSIEHAVRMAAVLWRPSKPSTKDLLEHQFYGDRREKLPDNFSEQLIVAREKLIKKHWKQSELQLIVFWWASLRGKWVKMFPRVWQGNGHGDPNPFGWDAVLIALSGGSILNDDAIANKPVTSVLYNLDYDAYQAELAELRRLSAL